MLEGDSIDEYLTRVKDLREQLINIDEILSDSYLDQIVLRGLLDSCQSFGTTLRLLANNSPNAFTFDNLVGLLLNEEQSCANRTSMLAVDEAMSASYRGKGKSGASSSSAKPKGKALACLDSRSTQA